jgi:hypothetical protein
MIRREERDDNVFRAAALTAKSQAHVYQREAIAQALAQRHEREARRVLALATVRIPAMAGYRSDGETSRTTPPWKASSLV